MTEDKAKTKWCPFVRFDNGRTSTNRWGDDRFPAICHCIASACMMWVTTEGRRIEGDCGLKKGG